MASPQQAEISAETPTEDVAPISRLPWLTPRRLILFVIGWLVLFAIIGVFVSNPFQSETSAGATPDYAKVMFLHGLLIGMVGLAALLTCQIMRLQAKHVRMWIVAGTIVATILAAVGGIWDKTIPGSEVPMWTQIFGFFALDEILITLVIGFVIEWRRGSAGARSLPFVAAALAAVSMAFAAVMGHLAGWIMEFGNRPALIGDFAKFAGFGTVDDFAGALVGSHSHEMAVGVMALAITLVAQQYGYRTLQGGARVLAATGTAMIAVGIVVMTAIYVAGGFSQYAPPTAFMSPDGTNGIAGDDIITGILVMGGGVLVVLTLAIARIEMFLKRPVRLAAAWSWLLSFATVVVAGFYIEMNETYYGAGDPKAAGANADAIFTWLHQDIGLFLLPAIVLVMLAVERLISRRASNLIGLAAAIGVTIAFIGGLVYVFVDPALHSSGYVVTTVGLLIVGLALLGTLWYGTIGRHIPAVPPVLTRTAPLWEAMPRFEPVPSPAEPMPSAPGTAEPEKEPVGAGTAR